MRTIFNGGICCSSDRGCGGGGGIVNNSDGGGGGGGIVNNSDGGGGGGGGARRDGIGDDRFIFSLIISMQFCICDAPIGMELPPQIWLSVHWYTVLHLKQIPNWVESERVFLATGFSSSSSSLSLFFLSSKIKE